MPKPREVEAPIGARGGLLPRESLNLCSYSIHCLSLHLVWPQDPSYKVLCKYPDAGIKWPATLNDFEVYNTLTVVQHPRLTGAFGSIDGLALPVQTAEG